eukprot:1232786-Rhodomonas_salina.1
MKCTIVCIATSMVQWLLDYQDLQYQHRVEEYEDIQLQLLVLCCTAPTSAIPVIRDPPPPRHTATISSGLSVRK